VIQQQDVSTIR
jgi:hypothetical protein